MTVDTSDFKHCFWLKVLKRTDIFSCGPMKTGPPVTQAGLEWNDQELPIPPLLLPKESGTAAVLLGLCPAPA